MRRAVNALLVLCLAVSLSSTTAYAASRRSDDGNAELTPLKKIVQLVKKVIRTLDGTDISFPKP